jgi:hypothetical protein
MNAWTVPALRRPVMIVQAAPVRRSGNTGTTASHAIKKTKLNESHHIFAMYNRRFHL